MSFFKEGSTATIITFPKLESGRPSSAPAPSSKVDDVLVTDECLATAGHLRDRMVVVTEYLETVRRQLVTF